ncbi:AarF/ABC1/UbiB kinase family protein [Nocardia sp. 2]|uniref:AarF/ABC1/UbiB kinase family protein n=2 Tax=Nocardia acididurans TaxID=2802282 RepID=A0ABS1MFZ7_9NOCA|nr:AarF/ABC1/UbiB kinase family protein [Nocardia acididurans]
MSIRRIGHAPETGRIRSPFARRRAGEPPTRTAVRNAKVAGLPLAFAGRQLAGAGRKALGQPATEVDRQIQIRTAQHMFEVLAELKGCAAKLGQIMSLYELVLPPHLGEPYREALSRLYESAPIMLPRTVHAAMAANLGSEWRALFREFDDRHAAGASIGQVHRAVWHDGRRVAVKLMYPGAREAVRADLQQLRRISVLATAFVPSADVAAVTAAICASVEQELDYAAEARCQRRFADAYAADPEFFVPQVITQCGDVVVSEWVDGIPMTRIIESGSPEERSRVGMLLLRFLLSTPSRTDLLYCDPHPGNFRILPDGRLAVLDFGACDTWPAPGFPDAVAGLGEAIFNGGLGEVDAALREHGFVAPGREFDVEAFAEAAVPICEAARQQTFRFSTGWLREQALRALSPTLSNVNRQMTIPAHFTPYGRSALTAISVICQLETEGALRSELIRWSPELAEVFDRFDRRSGNPADLAIVRQRRADAGESAPRLRAVR